MAIHSSLRAKKSHPQLVRRHFEAEDTHYLFLSDREVLRNVQCQAGLTQPRTSGNDNQIGRLKPRQQLVQFRETGRQTGHELLTLMNGFNMLVGGGQDFWQLDEASPDLLLSDFEDCLLRRFQQMGGDTTPRLILHR